MAAISTEKNGKFKIKVGNCAIDVKKLSNQFIIKAAAFLKNEIQRAKKLESKEKKKKTKHEATLSRYEIWTFGKFPHLKPLMRLQMICIAFYCS